MLLTSVLILILTPGFWLLTSILILILTPDS